MTLKVPAGGSTLEVSGDAWVFDTLPVEVILGLPFMKKNNIHLTWDEEGRYYVEIQGVKVPIVMRNGMF